MMFLRQEDFCHTVVIECPHDGIQVRAWLNSNRIPFTFRSVFHNHNTRHHMAYNMTEKGHAVMFKLRWG
jgi:hypothetical protein